MTSNIEQQKLQEQKKSSFQERLMKIFGEDFSKLPAQELRKKLEDQKQRMVINDQFRTELEELLTIVKRRENREARFAELATKNEKFKNKNVDNMRASEFLTLENSDRVLSSTFAYKMEADGKQTPYDRDRMSLGEGDSILVDFGENRSVNRSIGAGDLLPATIRVIKIIDTNGNVRIGTRKSAPRPGYYDAQGYIQTYTGYTLVVPTRENLSAPEYKEVASKGAIIASVEEVKHEMEEEKSSRAEYFKQVLWSEEREARIRSISLEKSKSFLENASIIAKKIEEEFGIPWRVTVGQSALETGYGQHLAGGNNYFGIKAKKGEASNASQTREVFEGKEVTITANFKSYEDMTESFLDYARFLTMNPRYVKAFAYAKDIDPRPAYYPKTLIGRPQYNPEQFLSEVISAGYATDPTYVSKVAGMWKNWDEQRLLSA